MTRARRRARAVVGAASLGMAAPSAALPLLLLLPLVLLPLLLLASLGIGCSRASLYAVTGPADGGGGDAIGGGDASGGGIDGTGGASGDAGASDADDDGPISVACPTTVLAPGDTTQTVRVGTQDRTYVLHVPAAYDGRTSVPLVLDFHGVGGTGMTELAASPYPAALDPEGVVMAFPDGMRGPAGTAWNVGPCCVAGVDDVAFARAVVAQVRGLACVDASRVYAVGVLTGGGLAHYLGCHAADVFAAVAPAAFDLLQENVGDCVPARPISVVSFRGNADSRVPYDGGPSSLVPGMPITFLGAVGTFDAWAGIDGCTGGASAEDANGCARYATCQAGVEVILCTKQGGHEDPGDPAIAWPVLNRHTL